MVWHAHMLNPRAFLEDTMLSGLHALWETGLPWAVVDKAITNTFDYEVSEECKSAWTSRTGRAWENADDGMEKSIECPGCSKTALAPWTTCSLPEDYKGSDRPGLIGNGYGDGNFKIYCSHCAIQIDKELLSVGKFVADTKALLTRNRPMPGTVLDVKKGMPVQAPLNETLRRLHPYMFPSRMLKMDLRIKVVDLIQPGQAPRPDMHAVRALIEEVLRDKSRVQAIIGATGLSRWALPRDARVVVRKMMSRYWENFSLFTLDLGGAVMRQGVFIEKMARIDWLHSPNATDTMRRLLVKYGRFVDIMASNKGKMAVPTLDVDLAWHTHQLSPSAYYEYTVDKTGRFVDHDDKVDEDALSQCFEWTSKVYQERYGEVYSECTCWYCESIRASHVSSIGRALGASKQEKVAEGFHNSGAAKFCPPDGSAHISAHNAVKTRDAMPTSTYVNSQRVASLQLAAAHKKRLDEAYAKAQKRAAKKGRSIPPRDQYYDHWGYPYYYYGPYMYPIWYDPWLYYGWAPTYVAGCGAGGWAACAAGSCGGGVAAGACGGPGVSLQFDHGDSVWSLRNQCVTDNRSSGLRRRRRWWMRRCE
jgi:hypothetical protein